MDKQLYSLDRGCKFTCNVVYSLACTFQFYIATKQYKIQHNMPQIFILMYKHKANRTTSTVDILYTCCICIYHCTCVYTVCVRVRVPPLIVPTHCLHLRCRYQPFLTVQRQRHSDGVVGNSVSTRVASDRQWTACTIIIMQHRNWSGKLTDIVKKDSNSLGEMFDWEIDFTLEDLCKNTFFYHQ